MGCGDEAGCAISRDENAPVHEDHLFKKFASLGSAEDLRESRPQRIRTYGIEPFTYLGVTGRPFYAVDGPEILLLDCSPSLKGSGP